MRIEQKLSISLVMIAAGNIVTIIQTGENEKIFSTVILFFIVAILLNLFPFIGRKLKIKSSHNKIMSAVLLCLSCVGAWFGGYTDLVCIFLFCFSLYLADNKRWVFVVYYCMISILLIVKFTLDGFVVSQMGVFLLGSYVIYVLWMHYVQPNKTKSKNETAKINYHLTPVSKKIVDIIYQRSLGLDYWEISDKLELDISADRVRRIISEAVKGSGFKNKDAFIINLAKLGVF